MRYDEQLDCADGEYEMDVGVHSLRFLGLPVHLVQKDRIWEALQSDGPLADEPKLFADGKIFHGS